MIIIRSKTYVTLTLDPEIDRPSKLKARLTTHSKVTLTVYKSAGRFEGIRIFRVSGAVVSNSAFQLKQPPALVRFVDVGVFGRIVF